MIQSYISIISIIVELIMLNHLIKECGHLYGVYRSHGVVGLNNANKGPIENILSKLNEKKFSQYLNEIISKP